MRLRRQYGFVKYYFREFQNRVLGVVTGFTREIGTIGYSVVAGLSGDACCQRGW